MYTRSSLSSASLDLASSIHWPTSDTAHTTSVATDLAGFSNEYGAVGASKSGGGSAGGGLLRMSARLMTVLPMPIDSARKPPRGQAGTLSASTRMVGE